MTAFAIFGPSHFAALAFIALGGGIAIAASRRSPRFAVVVRRVLAVLLLASRVAAVVVGRRDGAGWCELAPLHLCNAAVLVAAWALWTESRLARELTYFWSVGSLLALRTPDLAVGRPDPVLLLFFLAHGGVVIAGLLLPIALRWRPRAGAALKVFLWTNAYALAVLCFDLATSSNFLYLLAKPAASTPLDWFGPWPVYLMVSEVVALGLFAMMALPFRAARVAGLSRPARCAGER